MLKVLVSHLSTVRGKRVHQSALPFCPAPTVVWWTSVASTHQDFTVGNTRGAVDLQLEPEPYCTRRHELTPLHNCCNGR